MRPFHLAHEKYISSPEGVVIFDEVQGVKDEADRLKQRGVDILIAVGHAGYLKDLEIAEKVPDIDVVVGGHTNTFLWNGMSICSLSPYCLTSIHHLFLLFFNL